jgi:hypothetical protein
VVDSDARYLYYVLPEGKAIRYGITVGEDALAFSGIAKVGRKEEWPSWTPTNDIKKRLGNIPAYVAPGPHNPMGSRALYVYDGPKDTLYRIHGTNQPEYIGIGHLVGLHPFDQRGRDRSVQSGQDRHRGCCAGTWAGRLAEQSSGSFSRADATSIELRRGEMRTPGESPAFLLSGDVRGVRPRATARASPSRASCRALGQLVEQLVDLGRLDDQRRADRDHVAAMKRRIRPSLCAWATTWRRRRAWGRAASCALVGGELDRADHAHAARLADQRMVVERHQPLLELRHAVFAVSMILSRW